MVVRFLAVRGMRRRLRGGRALARLLLGFDRPPLSKKDVQDQAVP